MPFLFWGPGIEPKALQKGSHGNSVFVKLSVLYSTKMKEATLGIMF